MYRLISPLRSFSDPVAARFTAGLQLTPAAFKQANRRTFHFADRVPRKKLPFATH